MEAPVSYYSTHKQYFSDYYKQYHIKNREKMIEKASSWYLASEDHRVKHALACKRYLDKNKTAVYQRRNAKNRMKHVLRELLDNIKLC